MLNGTEMTNLDGFSNLTTIGLTQEVEVGRTKQPKDYWQRGATRSRGLSVHTIEGWVEIDSNERLRGLDFVALETVREYEY